MAAVEKWAGEIMICARRISRSPSGSPADMVRGSTRPDPAGFPRPGRRAVLVGGYVKKRTGTPSNVLRLMRARIEGGPR